MRITIAGEDYKALSRCLLGLHSYFFTLHCCFSKEQEERILCMMLVLRTLCDKIFAFQPAQESVSHTLKAALRKYFAHKNEAQIPSIEQADWLKRIFSNSRLVQDFVEKGAINDISAYLGQTLYQGALERLRANVPQTGLPLRHATAADLAAGRVRLSAEELAGYWKQAASRSDAPAKQFKNALVCGKYLALLEDHALLLALCDPSLYTALDAAGKRNSMELIEAAFPLMNESQKSK